MHFRLRLLLLVALITGAAAAFSGVAAAQPAAARSDDLTIIIRPVELAPGPPVVEEPAREPAPVLSPRPNVSKEWVVTQSGRFQALSEGASPAAVDAAVAEEIGNEAPEAAAVDGTLARQAVDAIFPVATPAAAAPQRESAEVADRNGDRSTGADTAGADDGRATAAAALKLQAATDRRARKRDAGARTRGAVTKSQPTQVRQPEVASRGSRAKAKAAAKRAARSKVAAKRAATSTVASKAPKNKQKRAATAKTPNTSKNADTSKTRAVGAEQRRDTRAGKASVRRQAEIRTATTRVKRALRAAADKRRRTRIPAPPIIDVPVTKVRDIVVHRRIAGRTEALLAAADRANLRLNGWGYRSTRRQIQLRRQHCGTSRYALYRMPSGRCWPPTAPPGKSMHERGLAIDFYVEGRKGKALPIAGTREFRWLKRNAAKYGFYNLPSEAWHWSVNGR